MPRVKALKLTLLSNETPIPISHRVKQNHLGFSSSALLPSTGFAIGVIHRQVQGHKPWSTSQSFVSRNGGTLSVEHGRSWRHRKCRMAEATASFLEFPHICILHFLLLFCLRTTASHYYNGTTRHIVPVALRQCHGKHHAKLTLQSSSSFQKLDSAPAYATA